jgi:PIN domain nuclease of toxin-antitoxin system
LNLLLDTNVFLWWVNQSRISAAARHAIEDPFAQVFVSAATFWEIAIKQNADRLTAPDNLELQLSLNRFRPLFITISHAWTAGFLPRHHDDPFDRVMIAQAQVENLTLVSRDRMFERYEVQLLRA